MESDVTFSDFSSESDDDLDYFSSSEIKRMKNQIISILQPCSLSLKQQILNSVAVALKIAWKDYSTVRNVISNLFNALQVASVKEHQSGWFRSVLKAVSGNNVSNTKVADLLGVHRHSIDRAKQQTKDFSEEKYYQFIQKPIIKRVRIHPQITNQIHEWMKVAFTPSSNSNNVVKKKQNKIVQWEVKHWRTESIDELYEMFCQQFEGSENDFKKGYFRKLIPWFVRKRINYSGLCVKHDMGIYYSKLLEKHRKDWHFYEHTCNNNSKCKCKSTCNCKCIFCNICHHGTKSSINGNCYDNSCTNCCNDECPMEFTENKDITWIERSYETIDGRLQPIDNEIVSTRMYMMERITFELQTFQKHVQHVIQWKSTYQELKNNLQPHHVIVRWDFIGNFLIF